jgi:diguanylate cyclase (GGDEF)-like protein
MFFRATLIGWGKVIQVIRNFDGIILLVGLSGLGSMLLVDSVLICWVSLFVFLVFMTIFLVSQYKKGEDIRTEFLPSINNEEDAINQTVEEEMKKIIFDDFQLEKGGKIVVKEIDAGLEVLKPSDYKAPQIILEEKKVNMTSDKLPIKPETKPKIREFQISDFFDVDSDVYKGESEPRTEFDFLLNKVLAVIKDVLFAHTVAFFWANYEKRQMVCEAKISDTANFMSARRFSMQHDIVSKIAEQSRPEIITRVNPVSEHELLPYYNDPEFIKSFVGVPVFFQSLLDKNRQDTVGVVAIDSKTEEAFGHETLLLLGQFTKLISGLIKSYTDKYDLLLDAELLNSIHRFQEKIRNDLSINTITQSLVDESSKLIKWDFISVILQDEKKQAWLVKKVLNRTGEIYIRPETNVDFVESTVGKVIKNNNHEIIEDLESSKNARYFAGENIGNSGSFIAVPVSSINKCYGALCVESKDKFNFSKQDVEVLYRLAENAASALEICYMNEIIKEYVIVDELTGVYSKKFWLEKFSDELCRADDFGEDLSLLLLSVDNFPELLMRYGLEGINKMLITLSKVIRAGVRPYDLVGRLDNNRFGILLVNTPANEAYLWAEKVRKTTAGVVIDVDGKSFSVTLSLGVCGATENITRDELFKNTSLVLQKAIDSGGNTVRVF